MDQNWDECFWLGLPVVWYQILSCSYRKDTQDKFSAATNRLSFMPVPYMII